MEDEPDRDIRNVIHFERCGSCNKYCAKSNLFKILFPLPRMPRKFSAVRLCANCAGILNHKLTGFVLNQLGLRLKQEELASNRKEHGDGEEKGEGEEQGRGTGDKGR